MYIVSYFHLQMFIILIPNRSYMVKESLESLFEYFLLISLHLNLLNLQEALKRRLNARIEYAKFLQDTAKEMAKEVQNSRSGEIRKTAKDLDEFLNRVRSLL